MSVVEYIITIKKPDYKRLDIISVLMLIFALAAFIYDAIQIHSLLFFNIILILLITARCIASYFFLKRKNIVDYAGALLLAAIAWFFQPGWNFFFGIIYLIAAWFERQAKFPLEIGVNETGVTFNSFPKKNFLWNDLSNVLIKDNLLTVDFKNNKLYQKDIEENISDNLEKEFNEFCRKKLDIG